MSKKAKYVKKESIWKEGSKEASEEGS